MCYWGGICISGFQVYQDFTQEKYVRGFVRAGVAATTIIVAGVPYAGPFLSIGISAFDAYWGDEYIYNNIDF